MTEAASSAMKEDEAKLADYISGLQTLVPFYELPLSKRIVVIDPQPPGGYDSADVLSKLKGLLQYAAHLTPF